MFKNKHSVSQTGNSGNSTAATQKQSASSVSGTPDLFIAFLKLILALVLVLALIYFLYHFVAKRTRKFREGSTLKNIGGVSVGTNRSIQLIRLGNEVLVVGVGETVQLLKEINDPDVIATLTDQEEKPDLIEENVRKIVNWTANKTLRKQSTEKGNKSRSLKPQLHGHLDRLKKERSESMEKIFKEVEKHE